MKQISETYSKNGWAYRLLVRHGDWAIYEQPAQNRSWFELVRIRFAEPRYIGEKLIDGGEYLPGDNAWGRDGFTFQTEAEARYALAEKVALEGGGKELKAEATK